MTTPDSLPEARLHSDLSGHLDDVRASRDLSGPAIARAHGIRRRRRALVGAGAALAAITVTAPFVWWNMRGASEGVTPATSTTSTMSEPSTTAPTTTSTPTTATTSTPTTSTPAQAPVPTGDADAPRITVAVNPDAPLAARPEVPYLLDTTLRRGDESTTFDIKPGFSHHPLARGRALLVERGEAGSDMGKLVEADGRWLADLPAKRGQYLLASVNDTGTRFVLYDRIPFSETPATLTLIDDQGRELLRKVNVLSNLHVAGFVGNRVFLGSPDVNRSYVWDLERNVIDRYTDSGVVRAVNERTGLAAFFQFDEHDLTKNCTTVATVTGPTPVPVSVTCGAFQPRELSSDGRYLLGIEPADGMMQAPSSVIDVATGRALVLFVEDRPLDMDSAFLPDNSVVLNLVLPPDGGDTRNTLLRCTLEGSCTRMVETIEMPEFGTTMSTRYRIVRE